MSTLNSVTIYLINDFWGNDYPSSFTTCNLTLQLTAADENGEPTGSVLATSNTIALEDEGLVSQEITPVTFTFGTEIDRNTWYCIELLFTDLTGPPDPAYLSVCYSSQYWYNLPEEPQYWVRGKWWDSTDSKWWVYPTESNDPPLTTIISIDSEEIICSNNNNMFIVSNGLSPSRYVLSFIYPTSAEELSKPINPTPENESTEVDFSGLTLSWENGGGATSYDIYFGNTVLFDEFIFLGNTTEISIEVPYTITGDNITEEVQAFVGEQTVFNRIDWNDVLYWRVDARDDEDNVVTGDVWSFDSRPPKTANPSPANESGGITLHWGGFEWDPVILAISYDTYIGTDLIPFVNVINSGETNSISQSDFIDGIKAGFNAQGLASYASTYYWRTDAKNLFGVTEGDAWNFTTIGFLPPFNFHTDAEFDMTWYALATNRHLVACARNKVFYEDS